MSRKKLQLPSRLVHMEPFRVMTVLQRAIQLEAAGRKIIHMEVGEPDFSTARPIVEAGIRALDSGLTQYTAAEGIVELREAISAHYAKHYGVQIDRDRIFITPGASGGLLLFTNLLVNAGEGVLLCDPAYPCYRNYIYMVGAEPQLVPVGIETNFQPSVASLNKHCKSNTSGLWLASPGNPTGTILQRNDLVETLEWAKGKKLNVLVDEIYHGLHYVDDLPSALEVDTDTFVVNSFSKYFGMTGWRLGWVVVPSEYQEIVSTLAQNLYISASSIAQYAALAAFEEDSSAILEQRRDSFRRRRDFLSTALKGLGFTLPDDIQGAFYIYAGIENFSDDSEKFCADILEEHGVAITPGRDFGESDSSLFVRFAFTTDLDNLQLGVERLTRALRKAH